MAIKIKEKEKDIQRTIIAYLELRKDLFFWRQNSGGFKTESGHFYKMGIIGAPDIFILKEGKIYGCEVKTSKGVQNENQKNFQKLFEKNGGKYFIARSLEDVIKIIK